MLSSEFHEDDTSEASTDSEEQHYLSSDDWSDDRSSSVSGKTEAPTPKSSDDFVSPSGVHWTRKPPEGCKTPSRDTPPSSSGIKIRDGISTPGDAFSYFITEAIMNEIVNWTNLEGRRVSKEKGVTWCDSDIVELKAFLGLALHAGLERSWDVPLRDLFSGKFANPIYRCAISLRRFEDLRRHMRFDDKRTRATRLESDKLGMISHVWESFLTQCRSAIVPEGNVTIGEQLLPFKGRCKFLHYAPRKQSKYGLKIFWLCESGTGFAIDGLAYVGRQCGEDTQKNLPFDVVKVLVKSLHHSGLNVTVANFFTSVPLAKYLLEKDLTLVGRLRRNKGDIPVGMKENKSRPVASSLFGFHENLTIVSYVPKKNKSVVLLSSMHQDAAVEDGQKKKPEIILHYNKTKCGVDMMDRNVKTYTCKRQTKRWPLAFFYNILDIAACNAFIIYTAKFPDYQKNANYKRRLFLMDLVEELVKPNMLRRSKNPNLQREIRESMKNFLLLDLPGASTSGAPCKRRRCYMCPSNRDRKSAVVCGQCRNNICSEHSDQICKKCSFFLQG